MRPEGWEENLRKILDNYDVTYMNRDECIELIEAGADAIREGLKKQGIKQLLQDPVLHYEHWHNNWGTIVFIGED